MKVEFSVPEKYAPSLRIGLGVFVHVSEEQDGHSGTVYAVESRIDPGTRTIRARAVPVKTGIRTDRNIQITQGLSVNDTLIISVLLQLSDGKGVEI